MIECTPEEWSEFLSQYRCYGTEGRKNYSSDISAPLVHKSSNTNEILGMVRYHDNIHKTYYIAVGSCLRVQPDRQALAKPQEKVQE